MSNTIVVEDWTNEVSSIFMDKIKFCCANETFILPIEFIRRVDYESELAPKE